MSVLDAPFSVRHFLLECDEMLQIRYKYYQVNNMKESFQDISVDNVPVICISHPLGARE